MIRILSLVLLLSVNLAFATPQVVVSIKPIHDLVSAVMSDVGQPILLIPTNADPHDYALLPSQISAMANADLIIWVGPDLEISLIKPIQRYANKEIMLINNPHLVRYEFRSANNWDKDNDPGSVIEGNSSHTHIDPHLWLAPNNAIVILQYIAKELSARDPEHATLYHQNAEAAVKRISTLQTKILQTMTPVQKIPYIVYHDAYQYFERAFDMMDLGSITLHPDMPPSAARLAEINDILKNRGAHCIFTEPQVSRSVVEGIATQYGLKVGVLDPMGKADISGIAAYEALLNNMAHSMKACLGEGKM